MKIFEIQFVNWMFHQTNAFFADNIIISVMKLMDLYNKTLCFGNLK